MLLKRKATAVRRVVKRRRIALEPLEHRLLLSLTPADISSSQQEALEDGLAGLAMWAEGQHEAGQDVEGLDEYDLMAQLLPVIGLSMGQALDVGDVLDQGLATPIGDYFAGDGTPTTDELVAALKDLSGTYGDLTITVDPSTVSGGLSSDAGDDELIFSLVFEADRSFDTGISLGPNGEERGFAFDPSITVGLSTGLYFDFSFGMDLTGGLSPEDAFFIRVGDLSASADASEAALSTGNMNAGFYDAQLAGGSMSLDADLGMTLVDPVADAEDTITLADLQQTEMSSLVVLAASGSASASLSVTAGSFGGFTPAGSPAVSFTSGDPFEAPDLSFTDFDELLSFTNLSSYSMLGALGQLGTWLGGLQDSSVLEPALQLAGESTMGDVLDLGGVLSDPDTGLIAAMVDTEGVPSFDSAQGFDTVLQSLLGLPPATIAAAYDETTNELTYHLVIDRTFIDTTLPFGLDIDLSPLVSIESASSVELGADATVEFTVGVDLSELSAELVATADGPSNGRLGGDARFSLLVGGSSPVAVRVEKTATDDNTDLDDLVADFDTALTAAGLGDSVQPGRDGNRLTLALTGMGAISLLALDAEQGNPILTELHFEDGQLAADSIVHHAFIEDASVSATATLNAADIDATADLGFLQLAIVDGTGLADVSVTLALKKPGAPAPGGRIRLMELFEALAGEITSIVEVDLSGSMDLDLPMQVTPNPFGGDHPANPRLIMNWPDITDSNTLDVQFDDADLLLDFSELDSMDFIDAFGYVAGYIADLEGISFLNEEIPVINVSMAEIADYAAKFAQLAALLRDNPARVLQDLEGAIEEVFGTKGTTANVSMTENNKVVKVELTLSETVSAQFPVDVDLDGLGLGDFGNDDFGNLVEFGGSAQLAAEVGVQFELDFGIDITDYLAPRPFLYDTTSLGFTAKVTGTDINFTTAVGPLGVWVKNGTALIDGDGDPDTLEDTAFLGVILVDDAKGDGKIYFDELGLNHAQLSFTGQVHAALPVYFPTPSNLLGPIDLSITDLGDIENTTTLTAPDFAEAFENFDLLNNLGVVIDGIDFVLAGVQDVLGGEVFGARLPMIGERLGDAADFIQDIRTNVVQELRDRFAESLDGTAGVIRTALFDALGPYGLDLLLDKDESGSVTEEDIVVTLIDADEDGQADDEVHVDMLLGKEAALVDVPIKFDVGLPALGLEVDGNVQLKLGFAWQLAFGISRESGFYLDTRRPDELTVGIEARIPDLKARGELLFLQLDVSDEDADGNPNNPGVDVDGDGVYPSVFTATITIDLDDPIDPDEEDKLTFGDLTSGDWDLGDLVTAQIEGGAALNLDLVVSYEGDSRFPSLATELQIGWAFQPGQKDLSGDPPTVAFNDVRLNVGDFITDFTDSLLIGVHKVTKPLQPVVDFLTEPIPVLSDLGVETTPLQLAAALGYADAAAFIDTVAGVIDAINGVPVIEGELYVPLGSFDLGGTDPRAEENLEQVDPNVTETVDPQAELPSVSTEAAGFLDQLHALGISLPIIESPGNIFRLLLGQDVNLFLFDLPELSLGFPFPPIKIGPIIPPIPLFISFSGYIGASIDLKLGYDTHGFNKYKETGDWYDIFSGLFISDRENADGTGEDVPEGTLTGAINAGLEISIVVASAGVSGGVALSLHADLNDPDNDGKIHLDEFLANLELGLLSTFDVSGEITARLAAYVEILFVRHEFTLAEVTIAEFELTDSDIYQDRFSGQKGPAGVTDLGVAPGLHVDGLSIETAGGEDWFQFELLRPDSVDVDIRHSYVRGDLDLEVYDAGGANLLGTSKTDRDREVVSLAALDAGTYLVRVTAAPGQRNNYALAVEPGSSSATRVIYVSPANTDPDWEPADVRHRAEKYYTFQPGNNAYSGLSYRKPKASLQSVLDTYDLGPNDLVVLETGTHVAGATITEQDEGATYVGSVAGSYISGITLDDSDNSRFYGLGFSGGGTGILIAGDGFNDATGNVIHYNNFGDLATGIRIDSNQPNLIEENTFTGDFAESSSTGIYLSAGVTATVWKNDVAGRDIGIYSDSRLADMYDNTIHGNVVGLSSRRGVLGPDNPAPFGTPGGKEPNNVCNNETGILIPSDAAGVIVRFNRVCSNTVVGIEQQGDNSQIIANDIDGNQIGIRGRGPIGPAEWSADLHNLVHDNVVGIWAQAGGEVRFNRVYANETGIGTDGDSIIHHNLVYRNTGQGILTDGARNVEIVNNTIYALQGDGLRLENFSSDVTIRNNIVWTQSGHGLYVAADSQFGYRSDYNNYFATGGGNVAFQGKAFRDLYDWQVEAESDLHSIGYTVPAPTPDDPKFVDVAGDDYRLQAGSTSIDAGDPVTEFSLEPTPSGGRVNLGAYGNTPQATTSAASWLRITDPNFYVDLVPSRTYEIRWETYNIAGSVDLDIDLIDDGGGHVADIATVPVSAGMTTWTPGSFVAGSTSNRYRIELTTVDGKSTVETSREVFAIPPVVPSAATTFYIDDSSNTADEYTPTATGSNRNTGTTADDPKVVIRPLVLSYELGAGDVVLADTGRYVHAVNLNLSGGPLAFDPRMQTVGETRIAGPTDLNNVALIDRANPHEGSIAVHMIDSPGMTVENLTIAGAEIGVRVRDGSTGFVGTNVTLRDHSLDGISIEGHSDAAVLDSFTVHDNGRHGIFVDSLLSRITQSKVYDNGGIGIALRSVGATIVETSEIYGNETGIDIINPGPDQAVIGHGDLVQFLGNLVHNNRGNGIFASGNVLVTGNTVSENGNIGIRLDDGADAVLNVVRQHVTGISARGSTSDIIENRSYANTETGIIASFDSVVQRNVTYSNDLYGIDVDRFSGVIDHNLVYETGYASINVEGPGVGAQLVNNTVYEPCAGNEPEPPAPTTVEFTWEWQVLMDPFGPPGPFAAMLVGTAQIEFADPIGQTSGGTFDLGEGGGSDALTPEPVPPGEQWQIDTEIVSLELSSTGPTPLGLIEVQLSPDVPSKGQIFVENMDGSLIGSSFFDLFVDFIFPDDGTILTSLEPLRVGSNFDFTSGIGALEVLQTPLSIGSSGLPALLKDLEAPPSAPPWGQWDLSEGYPGESAAPPPPQHPGERCAEIGIIVSNDSSRVLLRNNAVYVEGSDSLPAQDNSHDVIVESDSTLRWDSDFNILTTTYGNIGKWAGTTTPTLGEWQAASGDDLLSIDPPVGTIWVDPDGDDDLLGFYGAGPSDGRDDNLHLRSPFGQVTRGALAPVEDVEDVGASGLPTMQTVTWSFDPAPDENDLSPGVDWGDPSYDFSAEPMEHGKFINLGAYGDTDQTSISKPEYVHMVYPLGPSKIGLIGELVPGRTYEIEWRSHDPMDPLDTVIIELRHSSDTGPVELTIDPTAPNTGLYTWTVPPGVTAASDYFVVIKRPKAVPPPPDVVGASRRGFTIGPDTVPPIVVEAHPEIVELEFPTKEPISDITVVLSENLDAVAAADPGSYELRGAGPNGIFDDGDDVVYSLVPTYTGGAVDSDLSSVDLSIPAGPLPEGDYRLAAFSGPISDTAGLALDGDGDGTGGDDYVRRFTVDQTSPTVDITDVTPDPRNESVDAISIVFDEAVTGLGLADVRLTLDGGPNLLSGAHIITSDDLLTWTLPDLSEVTEAEGFYTLELTATDSNIFDLAGNPLQMDASVGWLMDTTQPEVDITSVSPDPRNTPVDQITFVFSELVTGFVLSDLSLSRDGGVNLLAGAKTHTTVGGTTWRLEDLAGLTAGDGIYVLTFSDDPALHDPAGNTLLAAAMEVWTVDSESPRADIIDVDPDPRYTAVDRIVIAFDEPVSGVDLSDLVLSRDGGGDLLTGSQTLTTLDGMNWTLGNLSGLTAAAGEYRLTLAAAGSGIRDMAGNVLPGDATDDWQVDTTPPVAGILEVLPDPHHDVVDQLTINFSEPVSGFDLGDLTLTRNGGADLLWSLTGAESLATEDNATWTLGNLSELTASGGTYRLTLTAGGSGIQDMAGNPLAGDAVEIWVQDPVAPTVDIADVAPDPRESSVNQIDIVFSEPVSGFDLSDLLLRRDGGGNLLPDAATLSTSDNITWTLGNLGGLTVSPGEYGLALAAPGSGIGDLAGNPLESGGTDVWLVQVPPAVVGRHIFYNNSNWDDPLEGRNDDTAIAPDKTALMPGGTATFDNYTSYVLGINGIIVDIVNPPGTIVPADFAFKAGNDNDPAGWAPAAATPSVEVRPGAGTDGSDRVTIIWPDRAIEKQWLEVTVLATGNTGLADPDVFYFGNAVGETGNSAGDAVVNVQDILITRSNPHSFWDPALIDTDYDFDRDQRVNATDILIARANQTWSFTALKLIDLSGGKATGNKAFVHDAAIERAAGRVSGGRGASSARMDWLYEFESISTRQRTSRVDNSVENAVDVLLAIYSP